LRTRRQCFLGFVKHCGEYGIVPRSYLIPESEIEKVEDKPVATGGFSEVWMGMYGGDETVVAVKTMRYYQQHDVQAVRKARQFGLTSCAQF
jgi:hypothetical protein